MTRVLSLLVLLCAIWLAAPPAAGAVDWQLVWSDEFDGTSLDPSKWEPQVGTGCPQLCGWGNNELQYYRAENATVSGGMLTIEAREESFGGRRYTSARLRTYGKADWLYGRFEMRAKLPKGQGIWPAFWMLPSASPYGTWAASGEIDIMEITGDAPALLHGTIHYGDVWPDNVSSGQSTFLADGDFSDDFHVFALEWEPTELRWYLDGKLYATKTNWFSSSARFPAPFDTPFHVLLNVAVGGNWPGEPDASTVFPQQMVVDYVRVYEDTDPCELVYDSLDHASPHANGWFQFGGSVGGGGIGGNTTDLAPGIGSLGSLQAGYGSGSTPGFVGGFGRSRDADLTGFTHFEMWINPDPGAAYTLELNLQDDDNGDGAITIGPDDEFQYLLHVGGAGSEVVAGAGWQRVVIPLSAFEDDNSYINGGNGILDTAMGGNGMMANLVVAIIHESGAQDSFRTDRWAFTRRTGLIAGRVWFDTDGDGGWQAGESGLDAVAVRLVDDHGVVATTHTNSAGTYAFPEIGSGSYTVQLDAETLPADLTPSSDPDGTASALEFSTELVCDQNRLDGNFGFRPTSTAAPGATALRDRLHGPHPNPFNARTEIDFELGAAGPIELAVFDTQGRRIRTLESGHRGAGPHKSIWDGTDSTGHVVASGVYYAALETPRTRIVERMVLVK